MAGTACHGGYARLGATLDDLRGAIGIVDRVLHSGTTLVSETLRPAGAARRPTEITRAARSLRVLADYLERHPESLIRGKTDE